MDRLEHLPTMRVTEAAIFCLDTETTGVEMGTDRVVELGGAYALAGEPGPRFRTLVDPEMPIPVEAAEIHGISDADVAGAPTWDRVAQRLMFHLSGDWLEGEDPWHEGRPVVAGYNAVHFDGPMLNAEQARVGYGPIVALDRIIDPIVWIRWFQREGYPSESGKRSRRLGDVCWYFGIDLTNAHSADADAKATLDLLMTLVQRGAMPDDVDELLRQQADLEARLAWEREQWAHYLYLDRSAWDGVAAGGEIDLGMLRLGFGKHSGARMVDRADYLRFCLRKFGDDIPDRVRGLFQEAAR